MREYNFSKVPFTVSKSCLLSVIYCMLIIYVF
jgi:hypothetical protein